MNQMEDTMNDETDVTDKKTQSTAHVVAEAVGEATSAVASVANQISDGAIVFRAMVRRQPITMALLMLWVGYALGRVRGGSDHPDHRGER